MASLWKHPNSKYWTACYTAHDGRQLKRSTKQTDRDKAMTVALELERAEEAARNGLLTEAQCRKVLSDTLERVSGDTIRAEKIEDFFKEWIQSKQLSNAETTAERYKHTVDLFLEHLGERKSAPLGAVTPRHVQGFLEKRMKSGCAPKTVVVDIKTLRTAFNRARRRGLITNNPADAVDLPKVESSERDTFTPAQVKALFDAAQGDWRTVVLLGYYTGARLSDCANMRWDNVDLMEGTLKFTASKYKIFVVVPLHPELEAQLRKIASTDKPVTALCPSLEGKKPGGAHGLSEGFKRVMEAAGLDCRKGEGKGERSFSKLSFHSLRHSFNSALANAGVSQEVRMKLTGHKTVAINTKYTHHELAPLEAAINKLPAISPV
ncbi:MAG: tyrosine-type recombinase/integrase [Verrucomicrobiia bacterium]